MGASKRTLSSDACRLDRLCAGVRDPVECNPGEGEHGEEGAIITGRTSSPSSLFSVWPEVGRSPVGRKKPQNEAVWWPKVLIPSFPSSRSFLAPPSLHFPGA